jgi:hypothetical protein
MENHPLLSAASQLRVRLLILSKRKRGVEGQVSSACSVDTTCLALTMGWLIYFREIPTAGFSPSSAARGTKDKFLG